MGKSLAQMIAELSPEEQEAAMTGLDPEQLVWDWSFWGRPEQIMPNDDSWDVGLFLAGRGAGKTRSAAEWIREKAKDTSQGKLRFLLVARTAADVREVLVEGESGIMNVTPPSEMPNYQPSIRRLTWPNGNQAFCTSADEPDSLRGVQAHYSWGDEVAAWRQTPDGAGLTAWGNLRFATRLGKNPQILATTTPKRVQMLYDMLAEAEETGRIHLTRGSTLDNSGNLAAGYLDGLLHQYKDNPLGVQELYGQMLDAVEGALWSDEMIANAQGDYPPFAPMRVIGVDPSVAENPGDYCGIVAVASTSEYDLSTRKAWVMEDASIKGAPNEWAQVVVKMAKKYDCPVVAEVNQGGALVAGAIHNIDPSIRVLEVHARQGKQLRAEPVSVAYHQKRVTHVRRNDLVELETQMVSWIPGEGKSPDRIDALVHGLTALLIKPPAGFNGGKITAKSVADRKIPAMSMSGRSMRRTRFGIR